MKVFMVTDGDYDSYEVIGLCTTREIAERCKTLHATDNDIKEVELDVLPAWDSELLPFTAAIDKEGDPCYVGRLPVTDFDGEKAHGYYNRKGIYLVFLARDLEHATQLVNQHRTELIASGRWEEIVNSQRKYEWPHQVFPL